MTNRKTAKNKGKRSRSKGNRRLLYISIGAFAPLLLLYLFVSFYYNSHFYSHTTINGINTANMRADKAEDLINAKVKTYILTLQGRDGKTDQIYGDQIGLHTVFNDTVKNLLAEQNGFAWPFLIFKTHNMEIDTMTKYDESVLELYFDRLKFFDEANMVAPKNAHISEYNHAYKMIPEDDGAMIIKDKLYEAVLQAITSLEPVLSIEEAGCYEEPKINAQYPKLVEALEKMNKIAGAKITYEFGEDIEILDGEKISKWLTVDEDYSVSFDKAGVKEYVDYIGKTYNSFGRVRTFETSYGDILEIKGGDYGWWLNRSIEVSEITELILNGDQLIREPVYFQTARQYGKDDIGDTYVEVNLTAQHLFFYKDGDLVVETDFVSGNILRKYGTPTGTYPIQYKQNDATLVGEDYATPVKYWMPFNGNIGFHDAPWRKSFGKDIYLTNGSHGCINMPPAAAKKMFKDISRGVAVVVYELEGTQGYEIEEYEDETLVEPIPSEE